MRVRGRPLSRWIRRGRLDPFQAILGRTVTLLPIPATAIEAKSHSEPVTLSFSNSITKLRAAAASNQCRVISGWWFALGPAAWRLVAGC